MSKRKFSGSMSGKGYYIALILCAVAIGISGYLYYANSNNAKQGSDQDAALVGAMDDQGVKNPTTQSDGSTEQTEPAQTGPDKRTKPIAGQTVANYAMDALSYNQTTRDWRTHDGIDIAAEAGAEVNAAAEGTVYAVYEDESMGTTVVIHHAGNYTTTYSSLDQQVSVKAGDPVEVGQTIGKVGNTALMETAMGDHLHFSVSCNGKPVDPQKFFGE